MSEGPSRSWTLPPGLARGAGITLGLLVVVDGVVWIAADSWRETGLVLAIALLAMPLILPAIATMPAALLLKFRGEPEVAKWIFITQWVLALLNAACTGVVFAFQ